MLTPLATTRAMRSRLRTLSCTALRIATLTRTWFDLATSAISSLSAACDAARASSSEVHKLLWFRSMSPTPMERRAPAGATAAERERSIRILAKSLVRDLLQNGYEPGDIVNLTTHVLDHVADHVSKECAKTARRD